MKPKHTIRELKKYAKENCRPSTYWAIEKTFKPFLDEEDGKMKIGLAVELPVNHSRRVKKMFKKFGIQAAIVYLTVYKKEKENEENIIEQSTTSEPIPSSTEEGQP